MKASEKLAALISEIIALEANQNLPITLITSLANAGAGTLREALETASEVPTRILSGVSGTVALTSRISARRSNVWLDTPNLQVTGGCLDWLAPCHDVDVTNFHLSDSPDDGIFFRPGTQRYKIHHCTVRRCRDEMIACGGVDGLVEYNLLYDGLPDNGAAMWTVTDSGADRVMFRRNLVINAYKRAGNANAGLDIQTYENVFINVSNATFAVTGTKMKIWHNIYKQGLDSNYGDWNVLKAGGGDLALGKNYQVSLAGVATEIFKKVNPNFWDDAENFTVLPAPMGDDFDWQAQLDDLYANAGAANRDAADLKIIADAKANLERMPAPRIEYKG